MNRTLQPPTPKTGPLANVTDISKGGTGGKSITEAVANLGGISLTQLDAANGVLKSDSGGKLPASSLPAVAAVGVTISGPTMISVNQTVKYKITNYDSLTSYVVTVDSGVVAITGDEITYNATPNVGPVNLNINGRVYKINVNAIRPVAPSLSGTTSGDSTTVNASFTSSAFKMTSGSLTHRSSDWELYSDTGLLNLVTSAKDDLVNLTGWSVSNLALNTTYYARVRHRSSNSQVSDWSATYPILTAVSYYGSVEEAKLIGAQKLTGECEGFDVDICRDGSRVVIGAIGDIFSANSTARGCAYVFVRNGSNWSQEARLEPSDPVDLNQFGNSVAMSSDGLRICVGSPFSTSGSTTLVGALYVYVRTGSTWTQEAKLVSDDGLAHSEFGVTCDIDSDGSRIVVAAYSSTVYGLDYAGAIYIYRRSGTSWTQETKLISTDLAAGDRFGSALSIDNTGSRIAIGAFLKKFTGQATYDKAGAAYVFLRNGTDWTQEAKVTASDIATDSNFGLGIAISSDGMRMAVGAPGAAVLTSSGVQQKAGTVYTYLRSGTTWTLEALLNAAPPSNDVSGENLAGSLFGIGLDFSGNADRLLIGAYLRPIASATKVGKAYSFTRVGSNWTRVAMITASDMTDNGLFGFKVAFAGDGSRSVIGSWGAKTGGVTYGAAYIHR